MLLSSKRKRGRRKVRNQQNVFEIIGFPAEKAAALEMKADLHSKIVRYAQNYKQSQLMQILNESQPRISDLLTGKISKFSLETLVAYADALQMRPQIRTIHPTRIKSHAPAKVKSLAVARA
jgi:predicted XRE-type DNA-binding protein